MSKKITNPNEKSYGFIIAIVAIIILAAAVIGYIVTSGNKAVSDKFASLKADPVAFSVSLADNAVELKADSVAADAPVVDIYEDYSCPHCAELAEATDADMKQLLEDGKIVVRIRSLNFLDRDNFGHSSKVGAAAEGLAKSGNAAAYWNFRAKLLADQSTAYGVWTPENFSQIAAAYGADDSVVADVKDEAFNDAYLASAKANAAKLEKEHAKISSPRVIINDKEVENPFEWVAEIQ